MMLTLLVEVALHSVLLGTATWVGLRLLRIEDPQAEMTVWKIVLIAAVAGSDPHPLACPAAPEI
jgi:hypothetical protein